MADGSLPNVERRLATATHRACEAAGGLAACRAETGLSIGQLSKCGSTHWSDSLSLRNAVRIDRLGAGVDGHPEILNAYASEIGAVVIMLPRHDPDAAADRLLLDVCQLTADVGDVARKIGDALACTSAGGATITPREADAALAEVAEMERKTAAIRHHLQRIAEAPS